MVFSKLFRNASSAPVLLQMWRSGLFDPKAYGDANEDITLSPMGCLLHYYKYGRFESRHQDNLFWLNGCCQRL